MSHESRSEAASESSSTEIQSHFASASAKRTKLLIAALVAVVLIVAAALILPRLLGGDDGPGDLTPLHIADTAQSDFQDTIIEVGRENGLDIRFTNFTDPYLPNTALVEGEVDANSFQHIAWLSQFNRANDADITPLFSTVISTWGLFSEDYDSADDIPQGARIAVPDDPANFSRALFILQSAGLLEVDGEAGVFPIETDITSNPLDLQFVRLAHESVQTAYQDPSIDAVVIATDDFDPALNITSEDALLLEDSSAESSAPYIIVVATRADNVDNEAWAALEDTYRDERVIAALEEEKRGEATIVDFPVDQLRDALAELSQQ